MLKSIVLIIIGISGGIVVGNALASFITLLDIIPRLAQLTNSQKSISLYTKVMIISVVLIALMTFLNFSIKLNTFFLIPIGLTMGAYIGLLAAALAEVVNVIPVLVNRLNIQDYVYYVLIALSVGKVVGSLLQWLILFNVN
ncbi:stage V sporulation protein AB [Caldisalinibacter kiritimatiensis]|uniref:Stage V sporulation protein AB n=1 Tax=Caldisalinibacter kiritimatiensis TaxID=1304284 RepID=R1AXZ1_9FIRM|nr:stage V sporulation protein AB [Caldisalinibacter kiritimatiensis]EOD01512.1 stage V sporulation protein AB [Caldisalinibacter kiritimatiensis]